MRGFRVWRVLALVSLATCLAVSPGLLGQGPVATPAPTPAKRDLAKLTIQQRTFYASAQRAKDWLQKANKSDGRFVHGFVPSLRVVLDGDHYTRQAGAAFALARGAQFFDDANAAAVAKQALLTLLLETTTDPKDSGLRYTAAPPAMLNRLSAGGMLVAAIHELPSPAKDLLDQADQLCNYLRRLQQADGSFCASEPGDTIKLAAAETEAQHAFAGPALYGLIRSQSLRPAAWKLEALRKARTFYLAKWKETKNLPMVPWLTAAFAEAYAITKEDAYAEAVLEMNDWLLGLQYEQITGQRAHWNGGFRSWVEGKVVGQAPDIQTAPAAESLAHACRVARQKEDGPRLGRYRAALENSLQFLTRLQYTEVNCAHFAEWFRPLIVGGFYLSHQDGNVRIDYTQHALSALILYWNFVADLPNDK